MEIVYTILLFIAPGLVMNAITEVFSMAGSDFSKRTIYEQMFSAVAHSVVISSIIIVCINFIYFCLKFKPIISIKVLFSKLDNMGFALFYITVLMLVTLLWLIIFNKIILKKVLQKANSVISKRYGVNRDGIYQKTVLENILYYDVSRLENSEDRPPMIVAIYKDGQFVTAGELKTWNANAKNPLEWKLCLTYEIGKILKEDKDRSDEEKWLHYIEYEYFNFEQCILVKFYMPTRVIEHWNE